jgi:hypothetical protein
MKRPWAAAFLFVAVSCSTALAKAMPKGAVPPNPGGLQNLLEGLEEFLSWDWLYVFTSLFVAAALSAVLAYHPKTHGKALTLEEVDQPKIFLMYSLVGALIGQICESSQYMAYVIFGLGGLYRFRTDVGPARDTGRLILATLIGVLCGLMKFVPAVVATGFGWVLIYFLESRVTHRLMIKGVEAAVLQQAADAYREVLVDNHITILSEKKNVVKKQIAFVFKAPGEFDPDQLEQLFKDIPPKLQGAIDWESS